MVETKLHFFFFLGNRKHSPISCCLLSLITYINVTVFLCLFCRVYINYFDMNAANVGWNGSTFA